jgi:hypothetical protein
MGLLAFRLLLTRIRVFEKFGRTSSWWSAVCQVRPTNPCIMSTLVLVNHHCIHCDTTRNVLGRATKGMRSKISRPETDDSADTVRLEWYRSGQWIPRLQWSLRDSKLGASGPNIQEFACALALAQEESSLFSQKMIVCILTQDEKVTLAGNRLKISGPPRFADNNDDAAVSIRHLECVQEVRDKLIDRFGIPLAETEGLDLAKSLSSNPAVWSQQ